MCSCSFIPEKSSQQYQRHRRQQQEKQQVHQCEHAEKAAGSGMLGMRIELQADKACKTRNRGPEPPDIHPEQQCVRLIGKAGEEDRRRDIADHLACKQRRQELPPAHHAADGLRDPCHSGKIAGEDEERHEGQQEHEVRF